MIFAIGDHVKLIIEGKKTQTRRQSDRYQVGKTYAIQPGRTKPGIKQGRIKIIDKECEVWPFKINPDNAEAEGGYTPEEFEELYEKRHSNWDERIAYTFRFVPKENGE